MADTEGGICLKILCGTPQARKEDYLSALKQAETVSGDFKHISIPSYSRSSTK